MDNIVLVVIGFIITMLLSINGFLFRNMVQGLNDIKLSLVKLTSEHDHNTVMVEKHEKEIDRIREKIHKLEGSIPSMVNFLEQINKDNIKGK